MIYTCTYFQETTSCANKHPHLIYNTDCDTISSFHDYEEQKKTKKQNILVDTGEDKYLSISQER